MSGDIYKSSISKFSSETEEYWQVLQGTVFFCVIGN